METYAEAMSRLVGRLECGSLGVMLGMLLPLIVCLGLAVVVLALVAIPARRQGRDLLTDRGEAVFVRVKTGAGQAGPKAGEMMTNAAATIQRAMPKERRH